MSSPFDLSKPVAIGSDHAGLGYKTGLIQWLQDQGYRVADLGVHENRSADYPDYAHPVASLVEKGDAAFGILLCGSANGVCMTANKHPGIRAALCWESDVAKIVRQHNDSNIICLPARFIAFELAKTMITHFMNTAFEGGRHQKRVDKIACQ